MSRLMSFFLSLNCQQRRFTSEKRKGGELKEQCVKSLVGMLYVYTRSRIYLVLTLFLPGASLAGSMTSREQHGSSRTTKLPPFCCALTLTFFPFFDTTRDGYSSTTGLLGSPIKYDSWTEQIHSSGRLHQAGSIPGEEGVRRVTRSRYT